MHENRCKQIAQEVQEMLEKQGAILHGHFIGTNGKHLDTYINKDALFTNPEITSRIAEFFAELFAEENIDVVAGPAIGGALLAQETAKHIAKKRKHDVACVFTEKGEGGVQELRRGYDAVVSGKKVLVVEDIVNTGGSLTRVLDAVVTAGGCLVGATAIVNRNSLEISGNSFQTPFTALLDLILNSYDEDEVPPELARVPINTEVGHGARYLKQKKG